MTPTRLLLAALLLPLSLSSCSWFDKSKPPLVGERIPVFSDRKDLEPDKDAGAIQITLPAPAVNETWPESGGYPNYAMQHVAIGEPLGHLVCGRGVRRRRQPERDGDGGRHQRRVVYRLERHQHGAVA